MKSTLIVFMSLLLCLPVFGESKKRTILSQLSGALSSPIASGSSHTLQIKNIGSVTTTIEITLSMYGKSEVVSSRYICILDLEGRDAPDIFQSQCSELADIGSSPAPDPLSLSASLASKAPSKGVSLTIQNGTREDLNGSVSLRITRSKALALKPKITNL